MQRTGATGCLFSREARLMWDATYNPYSPKSQRVIFRGKWR